MVAFTEAAVLSALDKPGSAWNRLALSAPQPDPFCATAQWQLAYREATDPERPLIVRHENDGLIHFALHTLAIGQPVLVPIERHWLFGCNLMGARALDLFVELLEELRGDETTRSWPVVVSGLDPKGAIATALRTQLGRKCAFSLFDAGVQCAASLEGGVDGFLSRRSANHRRNLRRYAQRAHEKGVLFERYKPASVKEAKALFARMLAVERASWKGIGRCGMEQPGTRRFYWAMLRRLSRSSDARIMIATHEGCDVGYIFGSMVGRIYRGQQFSFDNRYANWSIGNLLQYEQIRWLCEEGAQRYDMGPFLGPSMEYKQHWTEVRMPIEAWLIHPR